MSEYWPISSQLKRRAEVKKIWNLQEEAENTMDGWYEEILRKNGNENDTFAFYQEAIIDNTVTHDEEKGFENLTLSGHREGKKDIKK